MDQIIKYFTDDDLYKFTMCCAVIEHYPRTQVRYEFIDRADTVYPPGFADELMRQIAMLESLVITDEEIAFMQRRCRYIPSWFYSFLKGFRYDSRCVKARQDDEGHLHIEFEGCWSNTIMLEVKVLAIISELYYVMTGTAPGSTTKSTENGHGKKHDGLSTRDVYSAISAHAAERRSKLKT